MNMHAFVKKHENRPASTGPGFPNPAAVEASKNLQQRISSFMEGAPAAGSGSPIRDYERRASSRLSFRGHINAAKGPFLPPPANQSPNGQSNMRSARENTTAHPERDTKTFWEQSTGVPSVDETISRLDELDGPGQARNSPLPMNGSKNPRAVRHNSDRRDERDSGPGPMMLGSNGLFQLPPKDIRKHHGPTFPGMDRADGKVPDAGRNDEDDDSDDPNEASDQSPLRAVSHQGRRIPHRPTPKQVHTERPHRQPVPKAVPKAVPPPPVEPAPESSDEEMDHHGADAASYDDEPGRNGVNHYHPPLAPNPPQNTGRVNGRNDKVNRKAEEESEEDDEESVDQHATPKQAEKQMVRRVQLRNLANVPASPTRRTVPNIRTVSSTLGKRGLELDYDDGTLAQMQYEKLKAQDFDFDPAQAESSSMEGPLPDGLAKKLEHFRRREADTQSEFFTSMPIQEWEEAGDWFLERFSDIMQRLKAARREKREIVQQFEQEIADREQAVSTKTVSIGHTLDELRKEGGQMMRDKMRMV